MFSEAGNSHERESEIRVGKSFNERLTDRPQLGSLTLCTGRQNAGPNRARQFRRPGQPLGGEIVVDPLIFTILSAPSLLLALLSRFLAEGLASVGHEKPVLREPHPFGLLRRF
jgi:hypothetical protein